MIKTIEFKGHTYPQFQAEGNAARWIMPLALEVCKGHGLDIGYNRDEWKLQGAEGIDPSIDPSQDAMNLLDDENDFIFSSHCLEHIKENWMNVLDYWMSKLRDGGVLFLYLPHKSQIYWLPENNRKHIHSFDGNEIADYLRSKCYSPWLTPVDYNNSFAVVCYNTKTPLNAMYKPNSTDGSKQQIG